MDRSLQFFLSGPNSQKNPDSRTGLSTSNTNVQFDVITYDPNDPRSTSSEKKSVNFTLVNSLQSEGQFINYLGNSSTNDFRPLSSNPENESDIKLSNIIEWSKDKKALKLNAFHFAYLKNFNSYPANRMMILRRFQEAVPHDIMNTQIKPTNTMVTYYDLEKAPFTLSFKEEWTTFNKGIYELIQDVIGIKFNSIGAGIGNIIGKTENYQRTNIQQYLLQSVGQKLGLVTTGDNLYGDPNVIYESAIRKASGENIENDSSGLYSDIRLSFEVTYVMLETNGVDAKAAMLDIIANVINMGTSNSRFILTHNASDGLSNIIKEMERGNVEGLLSKVLEGLIDGMKKVGEGLSELLGAFKPVNDAQGNVTLTSLGEGVVNGLETVVSGILRDRFTRYRWQMRGAIGALSGMHTAPWHVTIGNPKYPWFTIGNLIVDKINMDFGGELGYNDMPTELTVKIDLKNGRSLGANEITSLFNNGRGRIYDTPEKIQKIYIAKGQTHNVGNNDPNSFSGNTINNKNASNISSQQQLNNNNQDFDSQNNIPNTSNFSLNNTNELDNNLL